MADDRETVDPQQVDPPLRATSWPDHALRHRYKLTIRDSTLPAACRLMLCSWPYAVLHLASLLLYAAGTVTWLCVMIVGAAWLGPHLASPVAWLWLILWLLVHLLLWRGWLRDGLQLLECGHVAVLTELITHGRVRRGRRRMLAHGMQLITLRFGDTASLSALQALVRSVLLAFHRAIEWLRDIAPPLLLSATPRLADLMLRASTGYLDRAVLSYDLARNDSDPWRASKDGVIYYCQNAKPILLVALRFVLVDAVATLGLWTLMLAPAAWVTACLPAPVRATGALVSVALAAMLAASLRAALLKPLLLSMILVRFHVLAEGEVINPAWDERLSQVSEQFRNLWRGSFAA